MSDPIVEAIIRIASELTPHLYRLIRDALGGDQEAARRLSEIMPRRSPDTLQRKLEQEQANLKWGDE